MTSVTHERFSIGIAYIAAMIVARYGLTDINYYLAVFIIQAFALSGARFPDLDRTWKLVKNKTTLGWIVNCIIHKTGGKHRSWQTHSWDICLVSGFIFISVLRGALAGENISYINFQISLVILAGIYSGWISHLLSDMLTSDGVFLFCWRKKKIRFVPKKIGKFRFSTGADWERYVYKFLKKSNLVLEAIAMVYPLLMDDKIQSFIASMIPS